MKNISIILFCIIYNTTHLKADTIPSLPHDTSLIKSLRNYYDQLKLANVQEYKYQTKNRFLNYLPSIGLENDNGTVRPTVGYSFGTVVRVIGDEQKRKQSIISIESKTDLDFVKEYNLLKSLLIKLTVKIENYYHEKTLINDHLELLENDRQLFAIQEDKYKNTEIDVSQFLTAKNTLLTKELNYKTKVHNTKKMLSEIKELQAEILQTAKFF